MKINLNEKKFKIWCKINDKQYGCWCYEDGLKERLDWFKIEIMKKVPEEIQVEYFAGEKNYYIHFDYQGMFNNKILYQGLLTNEPYSSNLFVKEEERKNLLIQQVKDNIDTLIHIEEYDDLDNEKINLPDKILPKK